MSPLVRRPGQYEETRQPVVMPWEEFDPMFFKAHKQGEHVAIVGPNGSGKTQLGLSLCKIIGRRLTTERPPRPARVTVLQYKPRDETVQRIVGDWPIITKWPPKYGQEHCIVWPRGGPPSTAAARQRRVFGPLLDKMYQDGNQTVYIPEAAYFERPQPAGLGLTGTMEQFWSTARSLKLTVISDTQRPRHVTVLMWTEPAWIFIYKVKSHNDLKALAEYCSDYYYEIREIVPKLGEHECLCLRQQRHKGQEEIYVTKVTEVTRNNRNERQ